MKLLFLLIMLEGDQELVVRRDLTLGQCIDRKIFEENAVYDVNQVHCCFDVKFECRPS